MIINIKIKLINNYIMSVLNSVTPSSKEEIYSQDEIINDQIEVIYNSLNYNIGSYWWKKYISSAFWKNISTPINLSITILTALTTGQIATHRLFNDDVTTKLSVSTLLISTINTFFRPNSLYSINLENMKKWADCGIEFEEIIIKDATNFNKLQMYKKLFKKVNDLKRNDESNFFTDLIYTVSTKTCLKEENWFTNEEKIKQELINVIIDK